MQAFKLRTTILALLVALMAAWVLAPTAMAQTTTLDMELDPPKASLIPESESGQLEATVKYTMGNTAQGAGTIGSSVLTITFTFSQCPASVIITGPATKIMVLAPQAGAAQGGSVQATFQVTMTREAPGLKLIQCTLTASAGALGAAGNNPPDDAVQKFPVSAEYYSLVQPKITKKLQQAGPQKQVPFLIELTNYGNARTQVSFEVGLQPAGKRWSVLLPDNLILDSPFGGGEGKTVDSATVTVATPYKNGWNNEQGSYQIVMKPSSADQPDKQGNPIAANVLVRVRGVYVPGLEPFVMVAAILGSALVMRMRKDDE